MSKKYKPVHIKKWLAFVGSYGCLVCQRPNDIHHIKHNAMRRNDLFVLPLCKWCHQDSPDSYHNKPGKFGALHGDQWAMYSRVLNDYLRGKK